MNKFSQLFFLLTLCLVLHSCDHNTPIASEPPSDWFFKQRAFPYQDIDTKTYLTALADKKESMLTRSAPAAFTQNWNFVGPTNVGGRITDIEMWPDDMNTILAGTASGGIFKSIDQGINWEPMFDDAASLAIGDMAISKSNPEVIYVGTGEANSGGGSLAYDGIGMYRSDDRGESWDHIGLEGVGSIGRVAVNPKDENELYVAAMGRLFGFNEERGIYKSKDGGSTWDHVLSQTDSTGGIDLAIHQENPDTLFAAMWERSRRPNSVIYGGKSSGIYRTFDGGENWQLLENGLPSQEEEMGRIALAIAPSNQNKIYAFIANKVGFTKGIYVSDNLGEDWTSLPILGIMDVPFQWWFSKLYVDPIDEKVLYLASFNMHRYKVGDPAWTDVFAGVHVDQHALYVHPLDPNLIINGNDGGIYISYNAGINYIKSENLPNIQFYTCEIDPNNTSTLYGGSQDNGTFRNTSGLPDDWSKQLGGDGYRVMVEPGNSDIFYCEFHGGNAFRSTDGGVTVESILGTIETSDRRNRNTPLAMDYTSPNKIYYGTQRVWESVDRGISFSPISDDLSNGPYDGNVDFGTITSIEVSRVNPNIIYAGTDDGNIWNSLDGGLSWNNVNPEMSLSRWTTSVLPDPEKENVAYVTFSGFRFDSNDGSVYKTIDHGETWADITANLPDVPVNDIQIDLRQNQFLFVATDIGVYYSSNQGGSWEILGEGLPNVPIIDIDMEHDGKLAAASYGRSMYYYDFPWTVSVSEYQNLKLSIYPNPATDFLSVELEGFECENLELVVSSMDGQELIRNRNLAAQISIGHLPKGCYYLSIQNKKGEILTTKRVVKM